MCSLLSLRSLALNYWASEASPILGCSIEISRDWASEASPTLGCSIEISRDIYICDRLCEKVHVPKFSLIFLFHHMKLQ